MKKYIIISAVLCAMLVLTPLLSVNYIIYEKESDSGPAAENGHSETIRVMLSSTGVIKEMNIREYVIGSVAGEMPPNYHKEALKAQAVVSFTFAEYILARDGKNAESAYISDESSVYQAYIDESARKEKWQDDFEKNEKIISEAVDEVLGEYIEYDGEPAMAVYFDKCYGRTESSENIWGKSVPYLISVTSDGDKLGPDVQNDKKFSSEELADAFEKAQIEYSDPSETPISDIERYESGVVKSVKIGGKSISGVRFREILELKSADFTVKEYEGGYRITCRGNGHFVGMSQYGADYMARQGSNYKEIIEHYYPGTGIGDYFSR